MKRLVCILTACFTLLASFCVSVRGAEAAPRVVEVDIGIAPEQYDLLTTETEKAEYPVLAGRGKTYAAATINIRGNTTKWLGLASETKRIPFELRYADDSAFDAAVANRSVKFITSVTPYHLLAEYLGLELFSEMGVPTPAHTIAFVQFNGVDFGLYLAVEDVNKAFLTKQYGSADGVALKSTAASGKNGAYFNTTWFGLTFEKVGSGSEAFSGLLDALDRGEGCEQYINVDEWLRYFACVAACGGGDSIFTARNSFILYDHGGVFDLIPWDQSSAFIGEDTVCGIDRFYVRNDLAEPNALFDLIMRNDEYRSKYHSYIRQIAEGFLSKEAMDARFSALLDAIAPYLPRDCTILLNRETAAEDLLAEDPADPLNLRYTLERIRENLIAQLNGSETRFYENEAYAGLNITPETVFKVLESFETPRIDKEITQKIRNAYPAWNRRHGSAQSGAMLWIVLSGAALLAIPAIAAAVKKKKKSAEA